MQEFYKAEPLNSAGSSRACLSRDYEHPGRYVLLPHGGYKDEAKDEACNVLSTMALLSNVPAGFERVALCLDDEDGYGTVFRYTSPAGYEDYVCCFWKQFCPRDGNREHAGKDWADFTCETGIMVEDRYGFFRFLTSTAASGGKAYTDWDKFEAVELYGEKDEDEEDE